MPSSTAKTKEAHSIRMNAIILSELIERRYRVSCNLVEVVGRLPWEAPLPRLSKYRAQQSAGSKRCLWFISSGPGD